MRFIENDCFLCFNYNFAIRLDKTIITKTVIVVTLFTTVRIAPKTLNYYEIFGNFDGLLILLLLNY